MSMEQYRNKEGMQPDTPIGSIKLKAPFFPSDSVPNSALGASVKNFF